MSVTSKKHCVKIKKKSFSYNFIASIFRKDLCSYRSFRSQSSFEMTSLVYVMPSFCRNPECQPDVGLMLGSDITLRTLPHPSNLARRK